MGIFDGLEKLINEHGSASILRERLDFARAQHNAEVAALKKERDQAVAQRDQAVSQLKEARQEIDQLKQTAQESKTSGALEDLEVSILKLLADARRSLTADRVAQTLNVKPMNVEYFLTKMEGEQLVDGSHFYTGQKSEYSIAHAGREYLIRRNLA